MTNRAILYVAISLIAVYSSITAGADEFSERRQFNWHQWRGPQATGVAPHGDPPLQWDEERNIKWKVPLPGRGSSTPVVWEDRIFILSAIRSDRQAGGSSRKEQRQGHSARPAVFTKASDSPGQTPHPGEDRQAINPARDQPRDRRDSNPPDAYQFTVICLDRRTGETVWQKVACEVVPHQGHHSTSTFAAASPVTDGRYVYCSFGSRGVFCYDREGNERWQTNLGQFRIKFGFGEGSSPTLYEDTLIVNCDHEGDSFVTALNAATGSRKWTIPRDENSTWNTPLVTRYDGRTQVIVNGARRSRSYDLESGELIWEYGGRAGVDAIPSPLRFGDLAILVSGLRGDPAYAVPLHSTGDLTESDRLAWIHSQGTPQVSSAVLVGDRLYFIKGRTGIMTCINARTGEMLINQRRLPGMDDVYASPVAAAGRIYFTDRDGTTVVIDATVDSIHVLAENKLDEAIFGSPAIVGREFFVRGEHSLYCIAK